MVKLVLGRNLWVSWRAKKGFTRRINFVRHYLNEKMKNTKISLKVGGRNKY